jgi:hypothetical protein
VVSVTDPYGRILGFLDGQLKLLLNPKIKSINQNITRQICSFMGQIILQIGVLT